MDTFAHAGHNVTTGTIQAQSEASTLLFVYFTFETHSIHTRERDPDHGFTVSQVICSQST